MTHMQYSKDERSQLGSPASAAVPYQGWWNMAVNHICGAVLDQLQTEYEGQKSVFGGELGGWLPDPAINACKDWLNAHHKFLEASATHR